YLCLLSDSAEWSLIRSRVSSVGIQARRWEEKGDKVREDKRGGRWSDDKRRGGQ
ncbi:hypothetical protein JOB18_041328, partial [Solea senegalensis]